MIFKTIFFCLLVVIITILTFKVYFVLDCFLLVFIHSGYFVDSINFFDVVH
jgi:hypothetical protein